MFIVFPRRFNIDSILQIGTKISILIAVLLVLFFGVYKGFLSKGFFLVPPLKQQIVSFKKVKFSLEKIGQGPLALDPLKQTSLIPDLTREVRLLGKNTKPSQFAEDVNFLLALRSSGLEYRAKNGEKIFLTCDPTSGRAAPLFRFSEEKTSFWVKPSFLEKGKVLLEVGLEILSKETGEVSEEKTQFFLQDESVLRPEKIKTASWFISLKEAKFWGQDVVVSRYCGSNYKDLIRKKKVEFPGKKGSIFCFLQKGDLLNWNDEEWVPMKSVEEGKGKPIVEVKSVSQKEIDFEVWDEEGFCCLDVRIDLSPSVRSELQADRIPQMLRLRTTKQVACSFGRKRCLLKEGDWMLRTSRGWRSLKRSCDIEDYLQHKLRGELCVFDALVRENGRLMMKGHWIDEMRVLAVPFSIPVAGDVKTKVASSKNKKSMLFRPEEASARTYLTGVEDN